MRTKTAVGMVIGAVDYLERDKIITVFTLDGEKISLRARGINAPKAKLKFAGELFSLCEFEFSDSRNAMLITATPKHMFWGIRECVEKLYLACFVLENISESQEDAKFLLSALSYLETNEYSRKMMAKFLFEVVKQMGIAFSCECCVNCESKLDGEVFFDFEHGGFRCHHCGGNQKTALLKSCQLISSNSLETLKKIKLTKQQELDVIHLLKTHIEFSLGKESKNIREIINMEENIL